MPVLFFSGIPKANEYKLLIGTLLLLQSDVTSLFGPFDDIPGCVYRLEEHRVEGCFVLLVLTGEVLAVGDS